MKARVVAPRARLELDRLEDRTTPTAVVTSGNLVITGTTGDDMVIVTRQGNNFHVREGSTVTKVVASTVTGNVQFTGDAGNDTFLNLTALDTLADGGAGNDYLVGGRGVDTITGGDGDDLISAGGVAFGPLTLGLDNKGSTLTGGLGADTIFGSNGVDTIVAGTGGTTEGDTSKNFVFGLGGNDTITGGAGIDIIRGGAGDDTINGEAGNDRLFGESGTDAINGGDGDDYLNGGADNLVDSLTGGAGVDTFATGKILNIFFPNAKKDTLVDFTEGTDKKDGGLILPF